MKNNIKVKIGQTFESFRPIHGIVKHKLIRIKENKCSDDFYNGWLIDENSIIIKPSEVIKVYD